LGALWFSKAGKEKLFGWILGLPLLKTLLAKVALVRFCRATATLLEGGVPVVEALLQARKTLRHPLLEEVIRAAEARISEGEPIYAAFQNHPLIPPLVSRMLAIAAEGGNLPFMLQQIAQIYEEELEKMLSQFSTMAQPLLLLALGFIVGFVLLSVLLPLTDVSSFTTN
jgi:general secretion pathway protein F/type IV pilus assembly protein PilC